MSNPIWVEELRKHPTTWKLFHDEETARLNGNYAHYYGSDFPGRCGIRAAHASIGGIRSGRKHHRRFHIGPRRDAWAARVCTRSIGPIGNHPRLSFPGSLAGQDRAEFHHGDAIRHRRMSFRHFVDLPASMCPRVSMASTVRPRSWAGGLPRSPCTWRCSMATSRGPDGGGFEQSATTTLEPKTVLGFCSTWITTRSRRTIWSDRTKDS